MYRITTVNCSAARYKIGGFEAQSDEEAKVIFQEVYAKNPSERLELAKVDDMGKITLIDVK